jgi:hypothetical protein
MDFRTCAGVVARVIAGVIDILGKVSSRETLLRHDR